MIKIAMIFTLGCHFCPGDFYDFINHPHLLYMNVIYDETMTIHSLIIGFNDWL